MSLNATSKLGFGSAAGGFFQGLIFKVFGAGLADVLAVVIDDFVFLYALHANRTHLDSSASRNFLNGAPSPALLGIRGALRISGIEAARRTDGAPITELGGTALAAIGGGGGGNSHYEHLLRTTDYRLQATGTTYFFCC